MVQQLGVEDSEYVFQTMVSVISEHNRVKVVQVIIILGGVNRHKLESVCGDIAFIVGFSQERD